MGLLELEKSNTNWDTSLEMKLGTKLNQNQPAGDNSDDPNTILTGAIHNQQNKTYWSITYRLYLARKKNLRRPEKQPDSASKTNSLWNRMNLLRSEPQWPNYWSKKYQKEKNLN